MPWMIANASRMAATEPHTSLGEDGDAKVIKKIHGQGTKILPIENSCQ